MRTLLSILFLISGATGLVYEVLWAKYLSFILGSTAYAHTLVLATFLGGLALGNAYLGKKADVIKDHLRFYGYLELGIAFFGLLSPLILGVLSDGYLTFVRDQNFNPVVFLAIRLVLTVSAILLPTFFMGGTLPVLVRYLTRKLGEMEASVSWFYFLNSAGAVVGSLLAGFYLIPTFGLDLSVNLTALVNILIGCASIGLATRYGKKGSQKKATIEPSLKSPKRQDFKIKVTPRQVQWVYLTVFLSGVVSLAFEISWIRILSLVLGSSTYSFSLMLSAFIAGIALGSYLVNRGIFPRVNSFLLLALAEIAIGVCVFLTVPIYERLPYYFHYLSSYFTRTELTFPLFQTLKVVICFFLMLLPTCFIGMTLPLASRVVTSSPSQIGKRIGSIFSVNTFGNVLGATLAGLVLLPVLGLKGVVDVGAITNIFLGISLVLLYPKWDRDLKLKVVVSSLVLIIAYFAFVPSWKSGTLVAGVFRNRNFLKEDIGFKEFNERVLKNDQVVFYKDDPNVTVSVHLTRPNETRQDQVTLRVNGKPDASSHGDLPTQLLSGHLPMFLKPDSKKVLVVGLGSGITAGAVLKHPIESLDQIEISTGVVEAAKKHFSKHNGDLFSDPRMSLKLDDAKSTLKLSSEKYDVIISEPSNPWMAGTAALFSREFYEDVTEHLHPGGLVVQWFHTYEMNDPTFRLIVRTFASFFKYITLWNPMAADILLIASNQPIQPQFEEMSKRLKDPRVKEDLQRVNVHQLSTLLSIQMLSDASVRRLAGRGRINEDRFPVLEYEAPRAFYFGQNSNLVYQFDERLTLSSSLFLQDFLFKRKRSLSNQEFADLNSFYSDPRVGHAKLRSMLIRSWKQKYPQQIEPKLQFAKSIALEGDLDGARKEVLEILSQHPSHLPSLKLLAEVSYQIAELKSSFLNPTVLDDVLRIYERLGKNVDEKKDRFLVNLSIARIHIKRGDFKQAFRHFDSSLVYGEDKQTRDTLIEALGLAVETGNATKKEHYLLKLREDFGRDPEVIHFLKMKGI